MQHHCKRAFDTVLVCKLSTLSSEQHATLHSVIGLMPVRDSLKSVVALLDLDLSVCNAQVEPIFSCQQMLGHKTRFRHTW
jgi:ethanolamine ammonia-lyase large subunit